MVWNKTYPVVTARILSVCVLVLTISSSSVSQNVVATVTVGSSPVALAVNLTTNKIYVANQGSNSMTVIDGVTNSTLRVNVGLGPVKVAVNSASNKIYVVNADDNTVTVVDGATNRTATLAAGPDPVALAVNPVTNRTYVANYYSNYVTVIDDANHTTNIGTGNHPIAVAVNSATNKIYVANSGSNSLTVIDGANNSTTSIAVGARPYALAVNQFTNQIYVVNNQSNDVSIVDGYTHAVTQVSVGNSPAGLAVNPVSGLLYVSNNGSSDATIIDTTTLATTATVSVGASPGSVGINPFTDKAYIVNSAWYGILTMIDGQNNTTTSIEVGSWPMMVAVNPVSNRVYVVNYLENTVSVIAGAVSNPLQLVAVTPCRVADTRLPPGPFGGPYLSAGIPRSFAIPQSSCQIPPTAAAYSLNVTVVPVNGGPLTYLTAWPTGQTLPVVSTLNSDGRVKANAAIVPAGLGGGVSVYATNPTDVILDINGYFQAPSVETLQFYPLAPCRAFDTRNPNGDLGGPYLQAATERDMPLLLSNCQIPSNAAAYSLNLTAVPVRGMPLGYLTVWAAGHEQPVVSTLNNPTATTVANAAIVTAGATLGLEGAIAVYPDQDTHLIADINGYFAPPGAGGLSLYPTAPCRVIDTRGSGGAFQGQRTSPVNVASSGCGVPDTAQEYVFNATVLPTGYLGFLTLWGEGDGMPLASTLNAADGVVTSNMAIVENHDGRTNAYAYGITQLILDISSCFAP